MAKTIVAEEDIPRPSGWRGNAHDLLNNFWFKFFIVVLILANAAALGADTYDLPAVWKHRIEVFDRAVLLAFAFEIALRFSAQGMRTLNYGWNWFDIIIVGVSGITLVFPGMPNASVLRGLRIIRILKIVTVVPSLKRVVSGLVNSIPGISSVVILLGLSIYMFAVITTNLFGRPAIEDLTFIIEAQADKEPELAAIFNAGDGGHTKAAADYVLGLEEHSLLENVEAKKLLLVDHHWGDLSRSTYALCKLMTLEGWTDIADETMDYISWSWIFFLVFIVISAFAVLNLFIGIMVDSMSKEDREKDGAADQIAEKRAVEILAKNDEIIALVKNLQREVRDLRGEAKQ